MNKKLIFSIVILMGIGLLFFLRNESTNGNNIKNVSDSQDKIFESILSGTTEQGDVAIELTPKKINSGEIAFDFSANTHSVDLSQFDLRKLATLNYEEKTINPISAPKLGGHHVFGELVFEVDKEIGNFEIKIEGIPKIQNRLFEWKI